MTAMQETTRAGADFENRRWLEAWKLRRAAALRKSATETATTTKQR